MGFMLGSLTSGLFSGASDVMSLMQNYQKIKQQRRLDDAADSVQKQIEGGVGDKTMPQIQSVTPAVETTAPSTGSFDDDPELKKISYGRGTSPREGKAFGGATPAVKQAIPVAGGPVDRDKDTSPAQSLLPTAAGAIPADASGIGWSWDKGLHPATAGDGSLFNWSPSKGLYPGTPAAPAPASAIPATPQYLPTAPPAGGPNAPQGDGTLDTLQQHSAAKPPMVPTLGNSMSGLGSQILAAMNPTAGATT